MKKVKSSNLELVGHDPTTNTLRVKFKSGGVYNYEGVSPAEHQAMLAALSIGSHFHQHIKMKKNAAKYEPKEGGGA